MGAINESVFFFGSFIIEISYETMQFKWSDLGITSDFQLDEISKKMGLPKIQYIGFAEDLRKLPKGLSIINLGGSNRGGTHWTMLWVEFDRIIYFDSYGVGPEDRIIKLGGERQVIFNTKQVQRYEEEHCGVWVLLAAKAISDAKKNNKDTVEALDKFVDRYKAV
jgi:hypothetical protein